MRNSAATITLEGVLGRYTVTAEDDCRASHCQYQNAVFVVFRGRMAVTRTLSHGLVLSGADY